MRYAAPILAVALAACLAPTRAVYRPPLMRTIESPGDKLVEVVAHEAMPTHEPRAVEPRVVASALLGSGLFLPDDADALAPTLAAELPRMEPDEQLRVVGWADDGPRFFYVLVTGGRLRILYYRGNSEASRHDAVIPTDIVAITSPPRPVPVESTPAPPVDAGVPVDAGARAAEPTRVVRASARHQAIPRPPPIGEAEARAKLQQLDDALHAGLISRVERDDKRKDILSRL